MTQCPCPTVNGRRRHAQDCPNRGRKPSGPGMTYADRVARYGRVGNPQVRLPERLGQLAARCVDEGREGEAVEALEGVLEGR